VSQQIGGLLAGAWEGERLQGFVYSLLGVRSGDLVHWSHMLAVATEARGRGLGRRLKLFQRSELLRRGVRTVYWTYDPLVARNAHLNINRLGATIGAYVPNMYGEATGSPLHVGGETDRAIVRWDLDSARTRWAVDGEASGNHPVPVSESETVGRPEPGETVEDVQLPDSDAVAIEVPADMLALGRADPDLLRRWRLVVRKAFLSYLGRSYAVQSFHRQAATGRCFYFLRRP
jgi:predicted GNAT superfamily acetyltransferase